MNNHTASLEITVNVHESVLSRKLMFWSTNGKHVIKYDLYVKHPRIFARNVQICAKFSCENFTDVCQYFEYYAIILRGGGRFFVDTLYSTRVLHIAYVQASSYASVAYARFLSCSTVSSYTWT